ncbi:MAG: T9SS type A sorting domain-containing protein [Dysgonamonadaceae bacterium]|jgi:hypothetical protein|nr:T9SS type A sorting domain-containing protein [Dysgonamonadaceae bacterium]
MQKTIAKLLFSVMLILTYHAVQAQISEGGTPPGFAYKKSTVQYALRSQQSPNYVVPIDFDVNQLRKEDAEREALDELTPLNAVKIIPVDITMQNSGEWSVLSNGQHIWQLTIEAPKAIATMLYYDEFSIPKGGKLFIYNRDKSQVLGAYTSITNPSGGKFATELVAGDVITLEYAAPVFPNTAAMPPQIRIEGVGYGYNHIKIYSVETTESYGDALSCNVNVHCSPEGDNWVKQTSGVIRLLIRNTTGSGSWCSGAIVTNVREDFTPYLLTAFHCIDETDASAMNQSMVYYHYEFETCENGNSEPVAKTMVGAQIKAFNPIEGGSDGALLRLNNEIPEDYNVYFNGWDASETPATSGVGIHHPRGDVKKISTYETTLTSTTWSGGAQNAHWRVSAYKQTPNGFGILESGSSGSPMFNQNGLIVGTLTGGTTISNCDNASSRRSSYGKLSYHWDQGTNNPDEWVKTYLDPDNTGTKVMNGSYIKTTGLYKVTFDIKDEQGNPVAGATVTLKDRRNPEGDYVFLNVAAPRTYDYAIMKAGYRIVSGYLVVKDGDINEPITLSSVNITGGGSESDPFLISNRTDLLLIDNYLGKNGRELHFRLTQDVDLENIPWTPIGIVSNAFHGILHGDEHQIKNLTIQGDYINAGLFGVLGEGACIENLHINGGNIAGSTMVGSIAGQARCDVLPDASDSIVIRNCSNNASVFSSSSSANTGGIIGQAYNNSSNTAKIIIASVSNSGNVTGTGSTGGIVGYIYNGGADSICIINSYSKASIQAVNAGTNSYIGGLVGYAHSDKDKATIFINKCYAAGTIESDPEKITNIRVGGLVGRLSSTVGQVTITQSIAAARSIKGGTGYRYRILGTYIVGSNYTLSNYAFADMLVNGQTVSSSSTTGSNGSNILNGLTLHIEQLYLRSTYQDPSLSWDFSDTWTNRNSESYPYFRFQSAPVTVTNLSTLNVTLNTLAVSDKIMVYKGIGKDYLTVLGDTENGIPAGDSRFLLSNVTISDALSFVNHESGKSPSYPVYAAVTSLGTPSVRFTVIDDTHKRPVADAVITLSDKTNPVGDYLFADVNNGNYNYSVTKQGYATATGTVAVNNANISEAVELSVSTGILHVSAATLAVKLYPNPVNDKLYVSVDGSLSPVRVEIYAVTGKRLLTQTTSTSQFSIDLSRYQEGVLLVKVSNANGSVSRTIVKQTKQ